MWFLKIFGAMVAVKKMTAIATVNAIAPTLKKTLPNPNTPTLPPKTKPPQPPNPHHPQTT
jgi:hypothetical protein